MCIVQANDVLGINDGNFAHTPSINVLYPPQLGKLDSILVYIHTHTHSGPLLIIHFMYKCVHVDPKLPSYPYPSSLPAPPGNHKFIL